MTRLRCHCDGMMEEKAIDHMARWGEARTLIRGVPALVCDRCGEVDFTPEVARRIQEIARANVSPDEPVITLPVRHYASFHREEAAASG